MVEAGREDTTTSMKASQLCLTVPVVGICGRVMSIFTNLGNSSRISSKSTVATNRTQTVAAMSNRRREIDISVTAAMGKILKTRALPVIITVEPTREALKAGDAQIVEIIIIGEVIKISTIRAIRVVGVVELKEEASKTNGTNLIEVGVV